MPAEMHITSNETAILSDENGWLEAEYFVWVEDYL